MTNKLDRDELRQRHDNYLINHYITAHVTVVSLALSVAGLAAASLIAPSSRFHGHQAEFWSLWVASLLATVVAYAGTMSGAIILPPRLPAMIDLLLPLLLGMSEFLLFAILAYQATGLSTVLAVLTGWWILLGAFGLLAALSILRASWLVSPENCESEAMREAVDKYVKGQRLDGILATVTGVLGVGGAVAHLRYGAMPAIANQLMALVVILALLGALGRHANTAEKLRDAFGNALGESTPNTTTRLPTQVDSQQVRT